VTLKLITILLGSILFFSCSFTKRNKPEIYFRLDEYEFRYDVNSPEKTWDMPHELAEISGLTYIDKNRLACNQDEKGNIYIYNIKKGELEDKIKFNGPGDYEAIEIIGNDMWIIKSNGHLYRVKDFMKKNKPKVHKHKTLFDDRNNIEGMGYYPARKTLLIACKGYPFLEEKKQKEAKRYKAVYEYNPETDKLNKKPFFLIPLDSIRHYKNYNTMTLIGIELSSEFDNAEGEVSFKPSGIAVHPVTGNIYVLASVGKTLAVLNPQGRILALISLNKKIHKQPEGICFSPDGTLYISNEGKGSKGTIMEFYMK